MKCQELIKEIVELCDFRLKMNYQESQQARTAAEKEQCTIRYTSYLDVLNVIADYLEGEK